MTNNHNTMQHSGYDTATTGKPGIDIHFLIRGCVANDTKCQKMLYEKYYRYAFKVAFRYVYAYDCVADVVNDAFVKVFKNIGSFICIHEKDEEPRFLGWIKRIVVNTAIDELRKTNHATKRAFNNNMIWEEPRSSHSADAAVLYKDLIYHVKRLPASYRMVFNMFVIDGFSHREIATYLDISVGASKSNLSRARSFLQTAINKEVLVQTPRRRTAYHAEVTYQ